MKKQQNVYKLNRKSTLKMWHNYQKFTIFTVKYSTKKHNILKLQNIIKNQSRPINISNAMRK